MEFNLNLSGPVAKKKIEIKEKVNVNVDVVTPTKIKCLGRCERKILSDGSGTVCVGCGNSWATPNWNKAANNGNWDNVT